MLNLFSLSVKNPLPFLPRLNYILQVASGREAHIGIAPSSLWPFYGSIIIRKQCHGARFPHLVCFKTFLALACPVQAVMACFGTARLFHTSCRIAHIQLSVSSAFQISTNNKTHQPFRLNFQLVRPVFMDNPEQDFLLFPSAFPYSLHSVSSSVSVRVLV